MNLQLEPLVLCGGILEPGDRGEGWDQPYLPPALLEWGKTWVTAGGTAFLLSDSML